MNKETKTAIGAGILGIFLSANVWAQTPFTGPSVNIQGTLPTRAHTMKADARKVRDDSRSQNSQKTYKAPKSNKTSTGSSQAGKAPEIHRSAADGRTDSVEEALEADPQLIRKTDASGYTALHHAAVGGHTDVVELLLERGAAINSRGSRGETALLLAASKGNSEVVKLLAEHGADVNQASSDRKTPLHKAAMSGDFETVEVLLEAGADPSIKDRSGRTAAELAERYRAGDYDRVVRALESATSE